MPRYRIITSPTYLNNKLNAVGEEVDYDGWPGSTLEPIDDVAKRVKAHVAARKPNRGQARTPDLDQFAEAPKQEDIPERRRSMAEKPVVMEAAKPTDESRSRTVSPAATAAREGKS